MKYLLLSLVSLCLVSCATVRPDPTIIRISADQLHDAVFTSRFANKVLACQAKHKELGEAFACLAYIQ